MATCDSGSYQIQSLTSIEKCIQKDLHNLKLVAEDSPIIFIEPIDGNMFYLQGAIEGPLSTPYEKDIFLLHIKLSSQHPVKNIENSLF